MDTKTIRDAAIKEISIKHVFDTFRQLITSDNISEVYGGSLAFLDFSLEFPDIVEEHYGNYFEKKWDALSIYFNAFFRTDTDLAYQVIHPTDRIDHVDETNIQKGNKCKVHIYPGKNDLIISVNDCTQSKDKITESLENILKNSKNIIKDNAIKFAEENPKKAYKEAENILDKNENNLTLATWYFLGLAKLPNKTLAKKLINKLVNHSSEDVHLELAKNLETITDYLSKNVIKIAEILTKKNDAIATTAYKNMKLLAEKHPQEVSLIIERELAQDSSDDTSFAAANLARHIAKVNPDLFKKIVKKYSSKKKSEFNGVTVQLLRGFGEYTKKIISDTKINNTKITEYEDVKLFEFIDSYLISDMFKIESEKCSEKEVIQKIKWIVHEKQFKFSDYEKTRSIIEHRQVTSLDEAIECASADIPEYTIIKKINSGSYKTVYLAVHNLLCEEKVALLVVDINNVNAKAKYYLENLKTTAEDICTSEAKKLAKFRLLENKYLPKMFSPPVQDTKTGLFYWTEEFVEERLSNMLNKTPQISEDTAIKIGSQIASALNAANTLEYFHGDLSLDNIGLSNGEVKVLDWGLCSTIPESANENDGRLFLGNRHTRAPEVYSGNVPTEKADIWSLGVILFRMLSGEYPFDWSFKGSDEERRNLSIEEKKKYEDEITEQIRKYCEDPNYLLLKKDKFKSTEKVFNIVQACLSQNPEDRPTASYIETTFETHLRRKLKYIIMGEALDDDKQ